MVLSSLPKTVLPTQSVRSITDRCIVLCRYTRLTREDAGHGQDLFRIDVWGEACLRWLAGRGLAHAPDGKWDYTAMLAYSFA